jgi:hypothetical protein
MTMSSVYRRNSRWLNALSSRARLLPQVFEPHPPYPRSYRAIRPTLSTVTGLTSSQGLTIHTISSEMAV